MPTAIVTGASSGIGEAVAARLAAEGWQVVATVRDPQRLARKEWPGDVHIECLDLAGPDEPAAFAARALERYGVPDVVVNNAGTLLFSAVEDTDPVELAELFRVNVFSQVELAMAFVPGMRERGSGTIVNVTSLGGRMVFPFFTAYNASKHAMEGFSEGMWHELKPFGIRVKAVEPGFVQTAIWDKALKDDTGAARLGSDHYRRFEEAMLRFEASIGNRTPPEAAAEEVWRALNDDSDRLRYPIAAYARTIVRARRWLGEQTVMRFFHRRWMGE